MHVRGECVTSGVCELDKSKWGHGPWLQEPNRVDFKHGGFDCLLHRGPGGHWCGYVGVSPSHPLYKKDYDGLSVDVHGGLTYASECAGHICHPADDETAHLWWFGFDCAHAGDRSPAYAEYHQAFDSDTYRDVTYARDQTESLAEQLAIYTTRGA